MAKTKKPEEDWVRQAEVLRVIDGDTVKLRVDCGCYVHIEITARLFGINAPEIKGASKAAGLDSSNWLMQQFAVSIDASVTVRIHRTTEKYGRWLVEIWLGNININEASVKAGMSVAWDGKGPRP